MQQIVFPAEAAATDLPIVLADGITSAHFDHDCCVRSKVNDDIDVGG